MAEQAGNSDLILENREKLTVTGVRRVLQCNAESAAIETARGVLQLACLFLVVFGKQTGKVLIGYLACGVALV